jgi:CDP-4-dehydro-6-deoxyglucose reductase
MIQVFLKSAKILTMNHSITVQPSGRQYQAAEDETLLSAAIQASIGLPYGCKDGACGSCKCQLISGEVQRLDHSAKALSADEAAAGMILTCRTQARSDVVIESRSVTAANEYPVRKMPVRVTRIDRLSSDVVRVFLQLPPNDTFEFYPGQYIDVLLKDGSRRSYSMANVPAAMGGPSQQIELHIRHMPGGTFTEHVFSAMKEKEILRIEGPLGSFRLQKESSTPAIMLASGTGFAPIKGLLEQLEALSNKRSVRVYWGGRRPSDLYLNDWLVAYCQRNPQVSYVPVVSDALDEDQWSGRTGFVHHAVMQDHPNMSQQEVYACGAPVVVQTARQDFVAQCSLNEENFFSDAFTTRADLAKA